MDIRRASAQDICGIMEVEEKSFLPEIQEERGVFLSRITECGDTFLVFTDGGGRISGYVSAEFMPRMPSSPDELRLGHRPDPSAANSGILYVSSFAILPEFRGSGTGKNLWRRSIGIFSSLGSVDRIILLVNSRWEGARHIYGTSGFSDRTVFPSFFPDGGDGILMEKGLRV